jgi:membrane carboxypeptidase/penicillin-binding protein PbpC
VVLPAEYAEWAHAPPERPQGLATPAPLRILSPRDGDRYSLPVGVDPRFATIGLRATGGDGSEVRWFVDGREWRESRWRLVPGPHTIRAVTARGESDEVRIEVR